MINKFNFNEYEYDALVGCLLGDGHLEKRKIGNSNFSYLSSKISHCEFVRNTFLKYVTNKYENESGCNEYYDKRSKKTYQRYYFKSKCNITYTEIRNIWYPNDGCKIVPKTVKLNPTICLFWYIGDGSLITTNHTQEIRIATNSFNEFDVDFLINQLSQFNAHKLRDGKYFKIRIPRKSVKDFLDYIGECPVFEYIHKWKLLKYKNKNIEENGMKNHRSNIEKFILDFKNKMKPYQIAKKYDVDISIVKYYLKKENLFKINEENNLLKHWKLISPDGLVYETMNITDFAKTHSLSHKMLRDLGHQRIKYYRNWKCEII